MRTCDHSNCPANATHLVTIGTSELLFCSHHFNKVAPLIIEHGYEVTVRPDLATV